MYSFVRIAIDEKKLIDYDGTRIVNRSLQKKEMIPTEGATLSGPQDCKWITTLENLLNECRRGNALNAESLRPKDRVL